MQEAPEFSTWREVLGEIREDDMVLTSVVSDTVFFHDELEPLRSRLDPNHPLAHLNRRFCFLDLITFENAVELARKHEISLAQILGEHYEDTRAGDPNTPSGRQFRSREKQKADQTFAWQFAVRADERASAAVDPPS